MNAAKFQRKLDDARARVELASALQVAHLELQRIETERLAAADEAKLRRMRDTIESVERFEENRQRIEIAAAWEGLPTSLALSVRLAGLQPVFTAEGPMFPVVSLVPLSEMVDQIRATDPHLFQGLERIVEEPHDDDIQAHRRDRWGDVPSDE